MDVIQEAMEFAKEVFSGDCGGHDFYHTLRVHRLALRIGREEQGDLEIIQLAALLHDVDDHKLSPETCGNKDRAAAFLRDREIPAERIDWILRIIDQISFSSNYGAPDSLEGKCVQDADRLDAMGAIGIARAFAYGGSHSRAIHDPENNDNTTTLQHFYDKLLRLKDRMNTPTGRELARERDAFMELYLKEFYAEWDGTA